MSGYYNTAQICLNGHTINPRYDKYPQSNQDYCDKCGKSTITKCPHCDTNIKGKYDSPNFSDLSTFKVPDFCFSCGKAYPWTEIRMAAVKELADEIENLDESEKEQLKGSIKELIMEGPKTSLAISRYKKLMGKAGKFAYEEMKTLIVEIVSSTVKKSLFD